MGKIKIALASALAVLALLFGASYALAHVPPGAKEVRETELSPIWIYGKEGKLRKFVIRENDLRGYGWGMKPLEMSFKLGKKEIRCPDGKLTICEVCVYRVMQLAISKLSPDEVPQASNFEIHFSHPCPGHEAAFRYITEGVAEYHKEVPEGTSLEHLTLENYRYKFVRKDTGEVFETRVLEGVFPEDFFMLREKVKAGRATPEERREFRRQWEEVRDKFLTADLSELFAFEEEEEEEEVPIWPVTFALIVFGGALGTTIYSVRKARR